MTSRTERFQRKPKESQSQDAEDDVVDEPAPIIRFSPEEEAVRAIQCSSPCSVG